jgi:hypothetical protein
MKRFSSFLGQLDDSLEENYRALAQKGIGAERKQDIKVGHGVDYYHPKDGSKHMGKIHDMDDKGYTVKDDKTGEKHKFDYFRKEEVEHVEEGRGAYDELARRMGTSSPGFNKTPAGKAREQKRRQEHLKGQMKFTQRMGGITGPKGKLPEEVELEEVKVARNTEKPKWQTSDPGYVNINGARVKDTPEDRLKHHQKTFPNAKSLPKNEEVEIEEADFSKSQTKMAHAIGKHFKSKGIGDESKGGPFAVASAMVRDKPDAAKKAYATIKAKMKNEDHQDMLMALYDDLSEENQSKFEEMLEVDPEKLLTFAQSHFSSTEE